MFIWKLAAQPKSYYYSKSFLFFSLGTKTLNAECVTGLPDSDFQ